MADGGAPPPGFLKGLPCAGPARRHMPAAAGGAPNSCQPAPPDAPLTESYYYLSAEQREVIADGVARGQRAMRLLLPFAPNLPGWVPFRVVAAAQGHGDASIVAAEAAMGGPFVWGSEFENVHSTWRFEEPGFTFPPPPPPTPHSSAGRGGSPDRKTTQPAPSSGASRRWHGSEQLFQAQKAGRPGTSPFEAAADRFCRATPLGSYGMGRAVPLREDWDAAKDDAMRLATRQKFTQSPALRALLCSTGQWPLAAVKPDAYWGIGTGGQGGANMLPPRILMELRAALTTDSAAAPLPHPPPPPPR